MGVEFLVNHPVYYMAHKSKAYIGVRFTREFPLHFVMVLHILSPHVYEL